jgi:predicted flap endonuclease-1-like 5' DNA nuclease
MSCSPHHDRDAGRGCFELISIFATFRAETIGLSLAYGAPVLRRAETVNLSQLVHEENAMSNIIDIEGIGETYAEKLKAAGINTVEELLVRGATPKGRQEIETVTGIAHGFILKWVNHADLFRINGVAGQFAELLEASGVDTVPELALRNPENLQKKMVEVNAQKNLANRVPSLEEVKKWIDEAPVLGRTITYE